MPNADAGTNTNTVPYRFCAGTAKPQTHVRRLQNTLQQLQYRSPKTQHQHHCLPRNSPSRTILKSQLQTSTVNP